MKYYKTPKFARAITSTGFISITACCLIVIGAFAWFALSKNNKSPVLDKEKNNTPSYQQDNSSYNDDNDISYEEPEQIADVDESTTQVPYEETSQQEEVVSFVLPVDGQIIKNFSDTALQYSATYGDMRMHTGIDIACEKGSNIKSVSSGKVTSVVDDANYGRTITIEYANGISVKYCGMGSVNVLEGDNVRTGDIIGTSGEVPCECTDNPHIHIEVIIGGKSVSPLQALNLE